MFQTLWALDSGMLLWIQNTVRQDWFNPFVELYTHLGDAGLLWIVCNAALLAYRPTRRMGMVGLTAMLFGLLITNVTLKELVSRPRPWLDVEGLYPLIQEHDPHSFPSGHTCASFAAVSAWWKFLHRGWTKGVCAGMAACMGLSRLYVGVHYPSDVLAGALVGIFCGCLACSMWRRFRPKRETDSAAR